MIIRADLHIHGRYSMATSKNMTPELLSSQGSLKGLHLVATGDGFHQGWLNMIEEATEEATEGVFRIKETKSMHNEFLQEEIPGDQSKNPETKLILTSEVEDSKRVHHLIILPSLDAAYQMRKKLKGNLDSDGRPRVRMNGAEIQELALANGCIMGPSHAFTPWTSIYKEYNSIHDCYSETPDFVELGLSADTNMADRIEELQELPFLTNSDAHSPWPHRLGREFNEIDVKNLSFPALARAIAHKKITANYGFDPRLGKYHHTACTKCYQQFHPEEALKMNMKCPCGGTIKKGVDYRVEELATWDEPHHPPHRPPYIHIMPLAEIISLTHSKGVTTKFVQRKWQELILKFGDEISVLIDTPLEEMVEIDSELTRRIKAFRDKTLQIKVGGGGKYGELVFNENSTLDAFL
ncbi:TIGR00375 family protein [Methanobacterium subterraneum]|uniref:TIGR00375 family protein n=1 Tax=Methanobacterium subterraneum TaxID=59277 RepID=A0A2H4VBG8_9EURY|nr:TIGR00375 family protein [Methanobacterium subterraneum]AUB55400.1 TIGR00375 family protein [Methanobacterium subterraneum]